MSFPNAGIGQPIPPQTNSIPQQAQQVRDNRKEAEVKKHTENLVKIVKKYIIKEGITLGDYGILMKSMVGSLGKWGIDLTDNKTFKELSDE